MKKGLRKVLVLIMAGVMTIAPVMTAMADNVVSGGTYQMSFPGWYEEPATVHQVEYSTIPIHNVRSVPGINGSGDEGISALMAGEAEAGYEIKQVYVYLSQCDLSPEWVMYTPTTSDVRDVVVTPEYGAIKSSAIPSKVIKIADFTVDFNGQAYPHCAMYYGGDSWWTDTEVLGARIYAAVKLPKGYDSNESRLELFDLDDNRNRLGRSLVYYFNGSNGTAVPATNTSTPTWKQDAKGWWVENPDGTYLTNQWYQYNGLWYYMGADGYMLTNTTTPDGYTVNADGVWVQ